MLRQLRTHSVALVSLMLAISSLGYNTWRNETTETQRSTRNAAFRCLESLAELQVIVDARQYEGDRVRGDYISGWARVLLINDLAMLLPDPGHSTAIHLRATWSEHFSNWYAEGSPMAEQAISRAITEARAAFLLVLLELE